MDKRSFRAIVRKKDPDPSTVYKPNSGPLWGGNICRYGIRVDGLKDKEYKTSYENKTCTIEVCEVAPTAGDPDKWTKLQTLATFKAKIYKKARRQFYFKSGKKELERVSFPGPSYANSLPDKSELTEKWKHWYRECWHKGKSESGTWRSCEIDFTSGWKPNWKPLHFYLDFEIDKDKYDRLTTILVPIDPSKKADKKALSHTYYIAFSVTPDSGATFRSLVTTLDAHYLLGHNCRVAAEGLRDAHIEMINKRSTVSSTPKPGTHFGSNYARWLHKDRGWKQQHLLIKGFPKKTPPVKSLAEQYKLRVIGCLSYPVEVCRLGFEKTFGTPTPAAQPGRPSRTVRDKIEPVCRKALSAYHAAAPKATFIYIAKVLVDSGWTGIYFNPDTIKSLPYNTTADTNYHKDTYRLASSGSRPKYRGVRVRHRVVDYCLRYTGAAKSGTEEGALQKLNKVNFGFLIAGSRSYGHCALLIKGKVYEVHYDESETSTHLFDDSPLRAGSSPGPYRPWTYGSGMIIVPRGEW